MAKVAGPVRAAEMERRSGVALWRQIADQIRLGIATGNLGSDGKLPPELTLSERFGVNRHTVRAAIAALVQEGVLRAEQGRGTFIETRRKLSYPIAKRTRFSTGLEGQVRERRSTLLAHVIEPPRP
jgi:GntR family phosphonate transport system transcriptional regulator